MEDKIDGKYIQRIIDQGNWIIRCDNDGVSYEGFTWEKIGEWTEAPDWNDDPVCGGGLHGQDKDHGGFMKLGNRLVFCETEGPHIPIDGNKVKVKRAKIIMIGLPSGLNFAGSLYLRGCTLPDGFTLGNVAGWLDLGGCTLPSGFTVGNVAGSLDLGGCTLPSGFTVGNVAGSLYLRGCTLPDGFTVGDIDGLLDLSGCTLPV